MSDINDAGRESQRLPNQIVSPTPLGNIINAAVNTKRPVTIPANTTLNELHGVLAAESIGKKNGADFTLGYFAVGIGGSRSVGVDGNVIERRKVHQHKASDNNLFAMIPMVICDINNDLDPEERKKYRIRTVKTDGNITRVYYWLKKINFDSFDPVMEKRERNPQTGQTDSIPHVPVEADLKPQPYELNNTNSIPMTNQYITSLGKMDLSLDANDLNNLRNVCQILYGDASLAAINEYGIFYGIETMHAGQSAEGGTVNYNELLSACIAFTITESHARDTNTNSRLPRTFNYGASQPLLFSADNA